MQPLKARLTLSSPSYKELIGMWESLNGWSEYLIVNYL